MLDGYCIINADLLRTAVAFGRKVPLKLFFARKQEISYFWAKK